MIEIPINIRRWNRSRKWRWRPRWRWRWRWSARTARPRRPRRLLCPRRPPPTAPRPGAVSHHCLLILWLPPCSILNVYSFIHQLHVYNIKYLWKSIPIDQCEISWRSDQEWLQSWVVFVIATVEVYLASVSLLKSYSIWLGKESGVRKRTGYLTDLASTW